MEKQNGAQAEGKITCCGLMNALWKGQKLSWRCKQNNDKSAINTK